MKIHNTVNEKIIALLKQERAITTSGLAGVLKVSWNTAEKYLLELGMEQEIIKIKKERVNLWMVK